MCLLFGAPKSSFFFCFSSTWTSVFMWELLQFFGFETNLLIIAHIFLTNIGLFCSCLRKPNFFNESECFFPKNKKMALVTDKNIHYNIQRNLIVIQKFKEETLKMIDIVLLELTPQKRVEKNSFWTVIFLLFASKS